MLLQQHLKKKAYENARDESSGNCLPIGLFLDRAIPARRTIRQPDCAPPCAEDAHDCNRMRFPRVRYRIAESATTAQLHQTGPGHTPWTHLVVTYVPSLPMHQFHHHAHHPHRSSDYFKSHSRANTLSIFLTRHRAALNGTVHTVRGQTEGQSDTHTHTQALLHTLDSCACS